MTALRLYHAGAQIIREPDIRFGRRNADFGQGFYLSDDEEFCRRWAEGQNGAEVWLNRYELCPDGLRIKRLRRDAEWFDYVFANRAGGADRFSAYDVVIGPIANDTIYDTMGVLTSGLLRREQALRLLRIGPAYAQTVIKTGRASAALRFAGAERLTDVGVAAYRDAVKREEAAYQQQLAQAFREIADGSES